MAGLFGGLPAAAQQGAVLGQYNPSALTGADRLSVLGAMLKDIGNGGQSNNISDIQQLIAGRQLMGQRMALGAQMAQMFDPQGQGVPSPAAGAPAAAGAPGNPNAAPNSVASTATSMRQMAPVFARAAAMGVDIAPYLSLYDKVAPPGVAVRAGGAIMDPRTGQVLGYGPPQVVQNGSYAGKIDPATGQVTWGGERPQTYDETLNQKRFEHQLDQDLFNNRVALGRLDVDRGNLGVNQNRLSFDVGKTPSVTPPAGFVVDK